MTAADDLGEREQLAIRPASKALRLAHAVAEGAVYGAAYAAPNYFASASEPVDAEAVWTFFTRRQNPLIQAFVDHWPPPFVRPAVMARFLDQSHAAGIEYHYDVSNAFYELFLDREFMFYTCADFHAPTDTIEQAQRHKADYILGLLEPKAGERIIELGCGWGSMLKHVFAATGDRDSISGLTLSRDQVAYIREKLGFTVELADFITHDYGAGTYDKIYSIGGLEHVRPESVLPLFTRLHAALKPGGRLVLHFFSLNGTDRLPTCMIGAQAFFPGSLLSLHSDHRANAERAGFRITHDSEHDYRPTLRAWFDRLVENRAKAEALVGVQVVNKYLAYLASSWNFFDLRKSTLHRLVLMKD